MVSAELLYSCIRNKHKYSHKQKNVQLRFSSDPNNVMGIDNFKYNGLVNRKTVGMKAKKDGKGLTLLLKSTKKDRVNKPAQMYNKYEIKNGAGGLRKVKNIVGARGYRKDLLMPALIKASKIMQSYKPVKVNKRNAVKKE